MSCIDLHVHSHFSDGSLTPKQILEFAYKNDVNILSITDHDTLDAYSPDLFSYAKYHHIELIPGVEISTQYQQHGFHVLGYHVNIENQELNQVLYSLRNARNDYLKDVAIKLRRLGYIIHENDFQSINIITKLHIAKNVINNKQNKEQLLKHFSYIPTFGEFIETMMNEGCPAYVKKKSITPMEASQIIKNAGGMVVLAHPVCYEYEDGYSEQDIINLVKKMNCDAIEAIYIYVDKNGYKINEIDKWKQIAFQHHLSITIGSDFHHNDFIHPCIGLINENIQTNLQEIKIIINDFMHFKK